MSESPAELARRALAAAERSQLSGVRDVRESISRKSDHLSELMRAGDANGRTDPAVAREIAQRHGGEPAPSSPPTPDPTTMAERLRSVADDDGRLSVVEAVGALSAPDPDPADPGPSEGGARTDGQPALAGGDDADAIQHRIADAEARGPIAMDEAMAAKSELLDLRRRQMQGGADTPLP